MLLVWFCVILLVIPHTQPQDNVSEWIICSSVDNRRFLSSCDAPNSSILFDGNTPTLTGLDGDMWASQLLTLQTTNRNGREIISDFSDTPHYSGVERVELVMFNCPEWGISVHTIRLHIAQRLENIRTVVRTFTVPTITSCDSLVRICIPQYIEQPVIGLELIPPPGSNWTHLAEVIFHGTCAPATIITSPSPNTPPDTTTPPPSPRTATTPTTTSDITRDIPDCTSSSCSTSTALVSVITAIATTLLATLIFVLVQIAVCKCHPKCTPKGAEKGTSAAGGEGQEYEEVDRGKGDVAVSDPAYMEVGGARGDAFQLKQNEAYATTHK